jgi:transcriptional regulator with XRE-family HTH domain
MRTERSSHGTSIPEMGAEFSFPVVNFILTGCDVEGMDLSDPPPAPPPKWPNKIRRARNARRMNLETLAAEAGVNFKTLQRWETKYPKLELDKVEGLARVLGVTAYDLLPYHPRPVNDPEIEFVIQRMETADEATRRAILRTVKGLTDRDADDFELRPPTKKR